MFGETVDTTGTTELALRQQLCEIGRRLYQRGFAAANDGNLTVRLNDRSVLCTPTGVSKGFMRPEDLCTVDYDGTQLAGTRPRSSEVLLHVTIYKHRPDVRAIVHCHPPHATAFAVAREPIPHGVLPEVEYYLGEIPMSPYETPGTQKFADTVLPYVKDCNTIVLASHGSVTFSRTLEQAYFQTEILDAYCRILLLTRNLGRIHFLTAGQIQELIDAKRRNGIDDPRSGRAGYDVTGPGLWATGFERLEGPMPAAFRRPSPESDSAPETVRLEPTDMETLVRSVTERVLAGLRNAGQSPG